MGNTIQRTKGKDHDIYDFVIVGGGFSGAYAAYQIHYLSRRMKICVLEASDRLGGRLYSAPLDPKRVMKTQDELGGMKVYPGQHAKVAELVKKSGCSLVEVTHDDKENLYYNQGKVLKRGDVVLDPATGRKPQEVVKLLKEGFNKEFQNADPMQVPEIRDLSLKDIFLKYGATETEFEQYVAFSGYDIFEDEEVSGALFLKEGDLYDSSSEAKLCMVHEGYELVPQLLAQRSRATVKLNCKVFGSENVDGIHQVHTSLGDVRCKNIIYAIPHEALKQIVQANPGTISESRAQLLETIKDVPLFKAFIEWPRLGKVEPWWEATHHNQGHSTANGEVRQVYYYDHENIMIYNSGKHATSLGAKFEDNATKATLETVEFLKEMHDNDEIPSPNVEQTRFKLWPHGSHKWKKGVDVSNTMKQIVHGSYERVDESVYICGDAYSIHQGWVMGCVETVDACIEKINARGGLNFSHKVST